MHRRSVRRSECMLMSGVRWDSCVHVGVRCPACSSSVSGSRGVLHARVHRECREASGMCVTTRGQGTEGCRGVGVGVEGVSVSVVGVGDNMHAGQRAVLGSEAVSKRKSYPGNYRPK